MIPKARLSKTMALATVAFACGVSLHGQAAPASADTTPPPEKKVPVVSAPANTAKTDFDDDGEIFVMSPFEVNAKNDDGYSAGSTLAGNRLNTDLKDVGSAVSVVTAQMLKDIGAYNNSTLLQYTTNTEVGNIYGTMANAGSGTQLDEGGNFRNPNQNTRVRGLTFADSTMDYFLTDMPWDGYNIDRVDFQRGPNAILFGLGSPGGIINAGTRSAGYKNKGEISFKYARFGSTRETLDVNRVLIDKQLALRIDGLNNQEKYQQKQAFSNDRRVYAALRYDPQILNNGSAHTTIKTNFEQGRVRSNTPRTLTPGDSITMWFKTGTTTAYDPNTFSVNYGKPYQVMELNKMGFNQAGIQDANLESTGVANRAQAVRTSNAFAVTAGGPANGTVNPNWQPWLGGQFGSSGFNSPFAIFSSADSVNQLLMATNVQTPRGVNSNGIIDGSITGIPDTRSSSITGYRDYAKKINLPGSKFGLYRQLSLSDPTIFDFYNELIDGPNKQEWQNFKRYNVNLSQTFLDGNAGFEAVLDKQHYDNGGWSLMSDKGQQLWVDVIQTLMDGTTNPNFGRPFIMDNNTGGSSSSADRNAFRFTAFGKHNFDKGQNSSFLERILGRHTVTGMYSRDTNETGSRSWKRYVADTAWKDFYNGNAANQAIDNANRVVTPVIYLGPSMVAPSITSPQNQNIHAPTVAQVVTGGSVRAFDSTWAPQPTLVSNVLVPPPNPGDIWFNPLLPSTIVPATTAIPVPHQFNQSTQSENPANYRGWVNTPISIIDSEAAPGNRALNMNGASNRKVLTTSEAINWQGYFWKGALVGMYGYRSDKSRSWTAFNTTRDAFNRPNLDHSVYYFAPPLDVKGSSNSWSGVLHLNKLLKERLPLNVSFFYNRSQNFQPVAGRVGAYGLLSVLPPPTGKTTDMGILLATKDGKYSLKINKYETTVKDAGSNAGLNDFYLRGVITDYQPRRNKYKFLTPDGTDASKLGTGNPTNWTPNPGPGQDAAGALAEQTAAWHAWDDMINSLNPAFLTAYNFGSVGTNSTADIHSFSGVGNPSGFTITENNKSKGYEFEVYAQPVRGLRLTFNASKSEATRTQVADASYNTVVNQINTALNTTAAGLLRDVGSTDATALAAWNANFWASWTLVKQQEGGAVPELRKWRANAIANYDFDRGILKGINVGAAVRWQDKLIIGYAPKYFVSEQNLTETDPFVAGTMHFDLNHPYYGPSQTDIDVWVGYSHRLTKDLNWRTQINVRGVNHAKDRLIPVSVQPDGSIASWRIAPTMVWSLTNTIEF